MASLFHAKDCRDASASKDIAIEIVRMEQEEPLLNALLRFFLAHNRIADECNIYLHFARYRIADPNIPAR